MSGRRSRHVSTVLAVGVCVGIFLTSLLSFRIQGTIPDTSWLLTVLDRMHQGDRLYRDVIETNPPFSVWLYLPPHSVASLLGISPELATNIYTFSICFAAVAAACWMMVSAGLAERSSIKILFPALLCFTTLLAGNTFTERDQIGAVMALPLFVLASWRADSGSKVGPRRAHWLVAGVCGSVLPLAKFYYAIVWITVGCWLAYKGRSLKTILLPEFLVIAVILGVYVSSVVLIYPEYFDSMFPLLKETYLVSRSPFLSLIELSYPMFLLTFAGMAIPIIGNERRLSTSLFLGSLSAWIPFFIQGKGWPYHIYPAVLFGSLGIFAAIGRGTGGKEELRIGHRSSGFFVFLVFGCVLVANTRFVGTGAIPHDFVEEIKQATTHPTVAMLGGDIAGGHPLTRMIGGRWIEPYCSDWILVDAFLLAKKAKEANDAASEKRYLQLLMDYSAKKMARFLAAPPDVILVDHGPLDNGPATVLLKIGHFDSILRGYRKIADSDRMAAYARR
jgi:hypothetical protein